MDFLAVLMTEIPSKAIVQVSREVQDVGELHVVRCEVVRCVICVQMTGKVAKKMCNSIRSQ